MPRRLSVEAGVREIEAAISVAVFTNNCYPTTCQLAYALKKQLKNIYLQLGSQLQPSELS